MKWKLIFSIIALAYIFNLISVLNSNKGKYDHAKKVDPRMGIWSVNNPDDNNSTMFVNSELNPEDMKVEWHTDNIKGLGIGLEVHQDNDELLAESGVIDLKGTGGTYFTPLVTNPTLRIFPADYSHANEYIEIYKDKITGKVMIENGAGTIKIECPDFVLEKE